MLFPKDQKVKLSPKKYRELCVYILERDPVCLICEKRATVDAHHVIKRSKIRLDTPNNLVGLCRHCHDLIEEYKIVLPDNVYVMLKSEPLYLP